ncbi:hypothetical protein BGZ73_007440 [Actinomortierella ambigua]|nr:hypothetical protein BGZ73_007440 [Actinomortierella ambigua]
MGCIDPRAALQWSGMARRAYSKKQVSPPTQPDEVKFPKLSELGKTTKILHTGGFIVATSAEGMLWYKYFKGGSKSATTE